jgi:hypothetical protein
MQTSIHVDRLGWCFARSAVQARYSFRRLCVAHKCALVPHLLVAAQQAAMESLRWFDLPEDMF